MKHYVPRLSLLQVVSICILALMCAPMAIAAMSTAPAVAPGSGSLLTFASLGMGGMILRAPAEDGTEGGGAEGGKPVAIADAITALEDKTLPMSQRLGVAVQALRGIDPTGQLATIKTELETARSNLTARDTEITDLKAQITALKSQLSAREADVKTADEARAAAEKKAADLEAKEQDLNKRAEAKSKEKLGALGIKSTELPNAQSHQPKDGGDDDKARILKMTGNERIAAGSYYQKHGSLEGFTGAA